MWHWKPYYYLDDWCGEDRDDLIVRQPTHFSTGCLLYETKNFPTLASLRNQARGVLHLQIHHLLQDQRMIFVSSRSLKALYPLYFASLNRNALNYLLGCWWNLNIGFLLFLSFTGKELCLANWGRWNVIRLIGISFLWSLCCEIKFLKIDTSFNLGEFLTFTSDPTIQNSARNAIFRKDLLKPKKTCYLSFLMLERRSCVSTLRVGMWKSSCTCILTYSELYDAFSTKQIEK